MTIEVYEVQLSKGYQFTLKAKSRHKHGLKPGQKIQVIDTGTEIVLRPKKRGGLKNLIGAFKADKPFDAVKEHDWIAAGFE